MASTIKLINVFDDCREKLRRMPLETVQLQLLQDALNEMWMAAPWRWTIGNMPSVTITAAQSDQTITGFPSDFVYLTDAWMTDGATKVTLTPEGVYPSSSADQAGITNKVAVVIGSSNVYRMNPIPTTLPNANVWTIQGRYKKSAPILTPQSVRLAGTQLFDDEWAWVYKEGVLYRAYLWGDDQRAGSMTWEGGKVQASQQMGVWLAALDRMKGSEPLLSDYTGRRG